MALGGPLRFPWIFQLCQATCQKCQKVLHVWQQCRRLQATLGAAEAEKQTTNHLKICPWTPNSMERYQPFPQFIIWISLHNKSLPNSHLFFPQYSSLLTITRYPYPPQKKKQTAQTGQQTAKTYSLKTGKVSPQNNGTFGTPNSPPPSVGLAWHLPACPHSHFQTSNPHGVDANQHPKSSSPSPVYNGIQRGSLLFSNGIQRWIFKGYGYCWGLWGIWRLKLKIYFLNNRHFWVKIKPSSNSIAVVICISVACLN